MGATSAMKATRVIANVRMGLAIEMLVAAQGLDVRLPLRAGHGVARAHDAIRTRVSTLTADRALAPDMRVIDAMIRDRSLRDAVESAVGVLG